MIFENLKGRVTKFVVKTLIFDRLSNLGTFLGSLDLAQYGRSISSVCHSRAQKLPLCHRETCCYGNGVENLSLRGPEGHSS